MIFESLQIIATNEKTNESKKVAILDFMNSKIYVVESAENGLLKVWNFNDCIVKVILNNDIDNI